MTHSLHIWNFGAEVSMRLAYPSSKRVKDWDKLEAEVKKHEKDEKLEGDAALNKWNLMGQYSQQTRKKLELRKSRALLLMVWSSRNGRSDLRWLKLSLSKSWTGWWLWWKKIEKELQKAKRLEPWKRFVKARRMNQGYVIKCFQ
ncbi:hypothetical protein HID58_087881 [Brassica napus]|uniref:Uncharacterized protein n=1 Tax=Brassica napus TaxID=3708 RepID=A0ABQ7XXJ4_BRANA|nr:hypothetical protein HID58_087881 [Brassica napus]